MLFGIVLFFNIISLAMAIYLLVSYIKSRKKIVHKKKQDDAS
jgi:hypothetical protein